MFAVTFAVIAMSDHHHNVYVIFNRTAFVRVAARSET